MTPGALEVSLDAIEQRIIPLPYRSIVLSQMLYVVSHPCEVFGDGLLLAVNLLLLLIYLAFSDALLLGDDIASRGVHIAVFPLVDRIPLVELRLKDRLADVWAVVAVLGAPHKPLAHPSLDPFGLVEGASAAALGVVGVLVGDEPLLDGVTF